MKGSDMKKFGSDLMEDMRSRNLLPLVILLVLAIVAVPFLIGGSGSEQAATPSSALSGAPAEAPPETLSAVVAYEPGLRDYKRRLERLNPTNPFVQQFAPAAAAASDALSEGGGLDVPPVDGGSSGGSEGGGGAGGGGTPQPREPKTETKYWTYETDVLTGQTGTPAQPRNNIPMFAYLPSDEVPALSYMGVANDGKQAVFLVSDGVTDIGGSGTCFPDASDCQLLGLTPGQLAQLTYGGLSYDIQVVRIVRKQSKKPPA
jgi:hypothetical protein